MDNNWKRIGSATDYPIDLGSCVKLAEEQIAVFRVASNTTEEQWYAVQNMNPYNKRMVLSRGIVGCTEEHGAKVACPLHKNNFALSSGRHIGEGEVADLKTFPIKVENGEVFIHFNN